MDDNNYMNNDNQSSGTPDNTDVFGQSSGTANGSDTYSQPQDTYSQPTDTYNQSVSQQESGNAYAYGQSSDQTGSTDGYVNNPGSAYGYASVSLRTDAVWPAAKRTGWLQSDRIRTDSLQSATVWS